MATDSSPPTVTASNDSPRHSASDKSTRNVRGVSSPSPAWTQIVRGGEPETNVAAAASATVSNVVAEPAAVVAGAEEEENVENGNGARRPAWNKLSNGAVEIAPVMGAESWPALSESARISTKSSSDSLKGLSDGSSSSQGIGTVSSPSKKHVSNIAVPNSSPNNMIPGRQRSMKRSSTNTSANSGNPQSPGSQGQLGEANANNPSPRDNSQRNFHPRAANDHLQQQRNSFKSRNGGSHNHNYGGRRDQERTNQDWNSHQNFNGREAAHVQSQRGYPRFMRHPPPPPSPPPTSAPFIPPPPVRPYGSPMGFPEMAAPVYYVAAPPESFRGLPFVAGPIPPHAVFFPPPDFQLHSRILNQIEYYFSDDNLIKDMYLRQNMDNDGWVSINLIAGFKKVAQLTDSIPLILDSLRSSSIVEVQGDKVRRRNEWMKWILHRPMVVPSASSSQSSVNSDHEVLAGSVQHMSLEENTSQGNSRKGSGEFVDNSEPTISEEAFQVGNQGDAVPTARNSSN